MIIYTLPADTLLVWDERNLKVHKSEHFEGSDFELFTFSLLAMLKYQGFVKKIVYWAIIGGDKMFCVSWDYAVQRIFSKLGKFLFLFFISYTVWPLYICL